MRVVFLGTGEIALPTLKFLMECPKYELVGVVTQPDKPVGRKQVVTPPQVKVLAEAKGIPVEQPRRVRKEAALQAIDAWQGDVFVVMAYGQILPNALLEMPRLACVNLHASLLPRHRGAAPIQAAIRDGDERSGITVMHVAEGLDTGDILLQHDFPLEADETGQTLHDRLAETGPGAIEEALDLLASGQDPRRVQDESEASHTGKLGREDGQLDWTQPAVVLERLVRAYHPWPGTMTLLPVEGAESKRLKIFPPTPVVGDPDWPTALPGTVVVESDGNWRVATGDGWLRLSEVQLEGKRRLPVAQFSKGRHLPEGMRLG